MKIYLAHPFDTRKAMRQWELETEIQSDIDIVNPFYDHNRNDVHAIDDGTMGRYEKLIASDIVERDLELVRSCDAIIGIISGDFSVGTLFELAYAYYICNMPLYIVCTNGHEEHPWIKYHATDVYTCLNELQKDLVEL